MLDEKCGCNTSSDGINKINDGGTGSGDNDTTLFIARRVSSSTPVDTSRDNNKPQGGKGEDNKTDLITSSIKKKKGMKGSTITPIAGTEKKKDACVKKKKKKEKPKKKKIDHEEAHQLALQKKKKERKVVVDEFKMKESRKASEVKNNEKQRKENQQKKKRKAKKVMDLSSKNVGLFDLESGDGGGDGGAGILMSTTIATSVAVVSTTAVADTDPSSTTPDLMNAASSRVILQRKDNSKSYRNQSKKNLSDDEMRDDGTSSIPIAYEVNNGIHVYDEEEDDDGDDDFKRSRRTPFFQRRSKFCLCCACILIVIFLALLIPLLIFAKELRESREIDAQRSIESGPGHKPSSIEFCQDEIVLLDPKTGRDLKATGYTSSKANTAGCYASTTSDPGSPFDLRFRRCPPYADNDWIGLFPSKASAVSRLWTSNLQGTFLCGSEPCSATERVLTQGDDVMRRTAIVSTLEEIPPGLYRFFLIKGESQWPYEYTTYSDQFRIVTNLNECNSKNNNNLNIDNAVNVDNDDLDAESSGNDPANNVFNPETSVTTEVPTIEWIETTEAPSIAKENNQEEPWVETTGYPWNNPTYEPTKLDPCQMFHSACTGQPTSFEFENWSWNELLPTVQEAAITLGFDHNMWNHYKDDPSSTYEGMENTVFGKKWWIELSNKERTAAETIGYTNTIWDTISGKVRKIDSSDRAADESDSDTNNSEYNNDDDDGNGIVSVKDRLWAASTISFDDDDDYEEDDDDIFEEFSLQMDDNSDDDDDDDSVMTAADFMP